MNVHNVELYSPNFESKVKVCDRRMLKGIPIQDMGTPLDTVFNEGRLVKALNQLSLFIKRDVICKYFNKPETDLGKYFVKLQYKLIRYSRIVADRIFLLENKSKINTLSQRFNNIDENSPDYIEELAKVGKTLKDKYYDINIEDGIIEDICKTNEPSIFVLNHPNYHKDKLVYLYINSLLSQAYAANSHQASCPRPRILVSKNMLSIINPQIAEIYKKMGMVTVDASLEQRDKRSNAIAMKRVLKDFLQGKTNLFIFPEGNYSSFQEMPLRERLQAGIADFILKTLVVNKSVRIVPIKINYNSEKNCLGEITIKKPIRFYQDKNINFEEQNSILLPQNKESFGKILDIIADNIS